MTTRLDQLTSAMRSLPTSELATLHQRISEELASRKPLTSASSVSSGTPTTPIDAHLESGRAFDWHTLQAGRAYVIPVWLRAYVHTKHGPITELVECDEVHRSASRQPQAAVFKPTFTREERSTASVQRFKLYAAELGDARSRFGKDAFALARAESIVSRTTHKKSTGSRPAISKLKQSEREAMSLLDSFNNKH